MEKIRIAIDAMGGDYAPSEIIKGAVKGASSFDDVELILVGQEDAIRSELGKLSYEGTSIQIRNASEIISTEEAPVSAVRSKKDSSIVIGARMVKNQEADAFMSSGSSGAVLAAGTLIVGRIRGVERPPLAVTLPTQKGHCLLLDCGANVDAKASQLLQFAKMGEIYEQTVGGKKDPTIALLNIGLEEEKGNSLSKETYQLLKACPDIHFIGNVESRDIVFGAADIIVTEAFAGNIALKMYEGTASLLLGEVKTVIKTNPLTLLGGALIQKALKNKLKAYDPKCYGGAPLLGLNGLVVKAHGNAREGEILNTIAQCRTFVLQNTNGKMKEAFAVI